MKKTIKLKIVPHPSMGDDTKEAWKFLRKTVREMAYQVSRVKNYIATVRGIELMKRGESKDLIKDYAVGMEALRKIVEERKDEWVISSRVVSDNAQQVRKSFSKTAWKEMCRGNRTIQNYRRDGSFCIGYDGKKAGISNTSGTFLFTGKNEIEIAAFSSKKINPYARETKLRIRVIPPRNGGQRAVYNRIVTQEYKPCSATIQIRCRDIFLNLSYEFTNNHPNKTVFPNRIVGLDIGIKKVATCVLYDKQKIKHVIHDEVYKTILDFRSRILKKRKEIGWAMRGYNDCRKGHGVKNKVRTFDRLSGKERDFQKLINNRISKAVVNFASKYGAEFIAVEDLSGIYESGNAPQKMLRRWAYFELQTMVEQKAKERGIGIVKVNPAYTTQCCAFCGHTEKSNVKNYKDFECTKCGKTTHNGTNAAINIAALGNEVISRRKTASGDAA